VPWNINPHFSYYSVLEKTGIKAFGPTWKEFLSFFLKVSYFGIRDTYKPLFAPDSHRTKGIVLTNNQIANWQ
jgi:hypothetical protein